MEEYLKIKQLIAEIMNVEDEVTETNDLYIFRGDEKIYVKDEDLREVYKRMKSYNFEGIEMYSSKYREVRVKVNGSLYPVQMGNRKIKDSENGINYSIGYASKEYCMLILSILVDKKEPVFRHARRIPYFIYGGDFWKFLANSLMIYTTKVESDKEIELMNLRKYATSYEFLYSYKMDISIVERTNFEEYSLNSYPNIMFRRNIVDSPPYRIYNNQVMDYYNMAMESEDPFTKYISFYHVIEYYFDEIFKKKMVENIRDRITSPQFSYKNDENIYALAKDIKKHMSTDTNNGKGNECESLKYVLNEYVGIEELKEHIDRFGEEYNDYYRSNGVYFAGAKDKSKIAWNDSKGVYTNLATRIYNTRNALVHSKSGNNNQYRPYEHRSYLEKEIPLIRSVAELVIIKSSEII